MRAATGNALRVRVDDDGAGLPEGFDLDGVERAWGSRSWARSWSPSWADGWRWGRAGRAGTRAEIDVSLGPRRSGPVLARCGA